MTRAGQVTASSQEYFSVPATIPPSKLDFTQSLQQTAAKGLAVH
jgi:hypothetical protein